MNEIAIINEEELYSKVYNIRGKQVMLDSDLAKIYGYTTKRFNEQVQRNIDKFDDDFRFQLTWEEINNLSWSQNATSMQTPGKKGGRVHLPYAFTEQGVYMLMTVLKGELATKQSKALIRIFKKMKDYIISNNIIHDRYIILDYNTISETIYTSDSSIKDADSNITSITKINDTNIYHSIVDKLLNNNEIFINS